MLAATYGATCQTAQLRLAGANANEATGAEVGLAYDARKSRWQNWWATPKQRTTWPPSDACASWKAIKKNF